jgi:hypothetical protein
MQAEKKDCGRCRRIGLKRRAHRIMPDKSARCDEHFRQEWGWPQLTREAEAFIERCNELEEKKRLACAV